MSKWVQHKPFDYIIKSINEALSNVNHEERLTVMQRVREYLEHYWDLPSGRTVEDQKEGDDEEQQKRKVEEILAKYKGKKKIDIEEEMQNEPPPIKPGDYLSDPFNYITYNINLALFTLNFRKNNFEEKFEVIEKVKLVTDLYFKAKQNLDR